MYGTAQTQMPWVPKMAAMRISSALSANSSVFHPTGAVGLAAVAGSDAASDVGPVAGLDAGSHAAPVGSPGSAAPSALPCVLSVNGGSSSIKFALYQSGPGLARVLHGQIERIGQGYGTLTFQRAGQPQPTTESIDAGDHAGAVTLLMRLLGREVGAGVIGAVGHRIVHGMRHVEPELITPELLQELRANIPQDPEHLVGAISLVEAFGQADPALPQVACFDTAFHRDMPRVATMLPIPRRYEASGVQRYGFHGLSYAFLMEELARLDGPQAAQGRVVLAHLGNGASLAAVHHGRSIDTSMGFTPSSGIPMGTRSGDLDPGIADYLERTEHMGRHQFDAMVHHDSGLLGMSETSGDMRELLQREADDPRAAEAIAMFCYQAKKCVGAYAAALGGIETLVFAGGIGEHAAPVRERICEGLGLLGIEIDAARNVAHAPVVSTAASRVLVRVVHTDEERMMARSVCRVVGLQCAASAGPAGSVG
jgi:acetate kinase